MKPYMYFEMQNKLSKTRESPLESMGQIISSRCPYMQILGLQGLGSTHPRNFMQGIGFSSAQLIILFCFRFSGVPQGLILGGLYE